MKPGDATLHLTARHILVVDQEVASFDFEGACHKRGGILLRCPGPTDKVDDVHISCVFFVKGRSKVQMGVLGESQIPNMDPLDTTRRFL